MNYTERKTPLGLDPLTDLEDDDVIVVGDASDPTGKPAKMITYADLKAILETYFSSIFGGLVVETPSESPDYSRMAFTFTAKPKFIITEVTTLVEGPGYTWTGGQAVLVAGQVPPGVFIRGYR